MQEDQCSEHRSALYELSHPDAPGLAQLNSLATRSSQRLRRLISAVQGITDLRELTTLTILNHGGSRNASVIRNLTGLTGLKALRIMDRAFPAAIGTLTGLTSLEMRIGRVPPDRIEEVPRSHPPPQTPMLLETLMPSARSLAMLSSTWCHFAS